MTTLLFDLLVIAAIVAAFGVREMRRRRRTERMTHARARWIVCPISKQPVTVSFQENARGERIGVDACSAFPDPAAVDCERCCLRDSSRATTPNVRLTLAGAKP